MIKALVFDVDGVLVDSEDISISVGIKFFRKLGHSLSRKDFEPHLGTGERTFLSGPADDNGIVFDYDEASRFFKDEYLDEINGRDLALPGAKRLIALAKDCGLMVAIASSAPAWKVEANVMAIGFAPSDFDAFITGADIKRNKPEPDIYQMALIKLGCSPGEAIVFEDSAGGITSSSKAGIRTVALETTIDRSAGLAAGAILTLPDLSAVPSFSSGVELESELFTREEVVASSRERLFQAARKAISNSYSPYSSFPTSAAILSLHSLRVYTGVNVENASYPVTICAERNALFSAVASEGSAFSLGAILLMTKTSDVGVPCGMCLQALSEFATPDSPVYLATFDGKIEEVPFSSLFPNPFRLDK